MKTAKSILAALALVYILTPITASWAADNAKTNVYVDCRCTDPVGHNLCSDFQQKVRESIGYALTDNATSGYGIGVHYSCIDLWNGIDPKLTGNMSVVSVAFTIYAQGLPGEIYEDSSVFRVGKDATAEMSRTIVSALGQIVNANAPFFKKMRATALTPSPTPTPQVKYGE
ncbi:MAG: hypothetical protein ACREQE_02645 [Candidatus Binataceae bacterium]